MSDVQKITEHLTDKGVYTEEYISRVAEYMERHEDLAEEFISSLPKNTFPDHYIRVKDCTAKHLGATTMLPRSAIYVALARSAEEDTPMEQIVREEQSYFLAHRKRPAYHSRSN